MPETSQDAFESLFPGKQPVSANELRIRSNSLNKNGKPIINVDKSLIGAESNFWPQPASNVSGLNIGQRGPRESRISVGEVDSCYTAPEPYHGYKRESSHR